MSCLISGELAKRHFCDEADLVGFGVGFDQPPVLTPGRSEYCILLRTGTLAHADRRHKDRGARLGLPPRHRRLLHPRDRRPDRRCPHRSPRSPASTTPFPADRFQPQRLPLGTDKGIGFTARTFRRHAVGARCELPARRPPPLRIKGIPPFDLLTRPHRNRGGPASWTCPK